MGNNPSPIRGKKLPVVNVSWEDCQDFIKRLSDMTNIPFRLPTEAEWEFAARGGMSSEGYKYAGSKYLNEVAWFNENSNKKVHPVGKKAPNELGLYDMSGNVWEWCQDWYKFYDSHDNVNGNVHVYRGGSWGSIERYCRSSKRRGNGDFGDIYTGFRLAL